MVDVRTPDWILWWNDDQVSDKDWIVAWQWEFPLIEQDNIRYAYNQYKRKSDNKSCTLFSSATALWNVVNYKYTNDDFDRLNKESYKRWRVKWKWRRLYKWIDLVRDDWNERNPDNQVISFRCESLSHTFWEAINKWYNLVTTFRWDSKYSKDKKDGILDWVKFWSTYWHAICIGGYDNSIYTRDSQEWYKPNSYHLKHYNKLIENNVYSKNCYYFVEEKRMEKTKEMIEFENKLLMRKKINLHMKQATDLANFLPMDVSSELKEHIDTMNNVIQNVSDIL